MNLDWKRILAGAVTWTGLVAGATWAISQRYTDNLRETISSYEKAKSWNVPQAIAATEKAATELGKMATDVNRWSEMRADNDKLRSQLTQAKSEGAKKDGQITSLKDQLDKQSKLLHTLEPAYAGVKNVTIPEGASVQLFDDKLSLGVLNIYPTWVECMINNVTESLHPGEDSKVKVGSVTFRIVLRAVRPVPKQVDFSAALMK